MTKLAIAAALLALAAAPCIAEAQVSRAAVPADSVREVLDAFDLTPDGVRVNGRYVSGPTTIAAGDTVRGPVVAVGGDVDVRGTVLGGVYALWGDVRVHAGADVAGGANAYHGQVTIDGGRVRGPMHATMNVPPAAPREPMSTGRALQLSIGWTGMLVVVALLVLVVASNNLEATVREMERDFGRAFLFGLLGQVSFLPLLLILIVAMCATVIGILLVPFALVAAPVALAGFLTLGWLALALLTGRALLRSQGGASTRTEALRALILGVVVLMLPWIVVAALQGMGGLAFIARVAAFAITWVAATAGLGATLRSRGGSAKARREVTAPHPAQAGGWQTPTPVAGVAAARRPIPARPGATPS